MKPRVMITISALLAMLVSAIGAGEIEYKAVFAHGATIRSEGIPNFVLRMHRQRATDVFIMVKDASGAYRFDTMDSVISQRDLIGACFRVHAWIITFNDGSYSDGWDDSWVNPADETYRNFLLGTIISPLLREHSPDGILLDDVRYPGGGADTGAINSFLRQVRDSVDAITAGNVLLGAFVVPAGDSGGSFYGQDIVSMSSTCDFLVLRTHATEFAAPPSWVYSAAEQAVEVAGGGVIASVDATDPAGVQTSAQYVYSCVQRALEAGVDGFALYYYPPGEDVWTVFRLWSSFADTCIAVPDTAPPPVAGNMSQIAVPVDSILVWGDAKSYLGFQLTQAGEPIILVKAMPSCYRSSLHTGYPYNSGPFYHYDPDCSLSHWYVTAFVDQCPYDGTYGVLHFTGRCPPRNSPYTSKWDCPEGQVTLWHYPNSSTHEDMDFCSVCGYEKISGSTVHIRKAGISYDTGDMLYFAQIDGVWYVFVGDSSLHPNLTITISAPESVAPGDTAEVQILVANTGDGNCFEIDIHAETDTAGVTITDTGEGTLLPAENKLTIEWTRKNNGLLPGERVAYSFKFCASDTGAVVVETNVLAKLHNSTITDYAPDSGEDGTNGFPCVQKEIVIR